MRPFQFEKVKNIDEALRKRDINLQYIAGGTNLVDLMKKHIAEPELVLNITEALSDKIESSTKSIRIGAMVKNSVLADHSEIKSDFPLVSKAIQAGASPQIRNMASVGGNLLQRTRCPYFYDVTTPCNKRKPGSGCSALNGANRMNAIVGYNEQCVAVHPSDMCVALTALDASVVVTLADKKVKTIPFKDFHKLPENTPWKDNTLPEKAIITNIDIPRNSFHKNFAYIKLRDRSSYAFALVSVASALQLEGNKIIAARLASGGVAHKPWRWYKAEEYLKGKTVSPEVFSQAAAIAISGIKPLSENGFKVSMLKGAIETALQNCLQTS